MIIRMSRALILTGFLLIAASCSDPDPMQKILQERMRYEVDLLSWAIMENKNIVANVRVSGPKESAIRSLTVRFDQFNENKDLMKTNWIPFDCAELKETGSRDFTIILECGDEKVSFLVADIEVKPSSESLRNIKELERLL